MRNRLPLFSPVATLVFMAVLRPALTTPIDSSLFAQQNSAADRPRGKKHADVITEVDLRAHADLSNVYLAVLALHSNWLRVRNADSPSSSAAARIVVPEGWRAPSGVGVGIQVYLDDHRVGGLELLQNIPVRSVYSIRHLSGVEAQARYGMGHAAGVIAVATAAAWDHP